MASCKCALLLHFFIMNFYLRLNAIPIEDFFVCGAFLVNIKYILYKRPLDSYACPNQSKTRDRLNKKITCKKYSELVHLYEKTHSGCALCSLAFLAPKAFFLPSLYTL